jgi:serine/threonine protein kinase/CRP-like cAMP-binding protein
METFGRYEIVERLAVGGMAEILLARSASLGGVEKVCVIKRILPQFSSDLTFVSMFIDEARITIGLDHPNIVKLFDFGQSDGTYFMAIEYVDGTDLASLIRTHFQRAQPMPPQVAAYLARELMSGLFHAHTLKDHKGQPLKIVHRDVSPQNVLLSSTGAVKLADFGIAAARHKLTATSPGTVLGKAAYMAPEQAMGQAIDFRVDIWATGVILHEMLCGERLFADDNPVSTIGRVVSQPVQLPSKKRADVPPELDRIVMRALERDPRRRYESAQAMADDLSRWLDQHPFTAKDLAHHLASIEWADDTSPMRPSHRQRLSDRPGDGREAPSPDGATAVRPPQVANDAVLQRLYAALGEEPDLWTLVEIADRYAELGHPQTAVTAYRAAAAVFAYRGLLVQMLCAYDGARRHLPPTEVFADLIALVDLLDQFAAAPFWSILKDVDPDGLGSDEGAAAKAPAITPLFGNLAPREFARLAEVARVRRVAVGEVVIAEGDEGDALYAVGKGRLVVSCKPGVGGEAGEADVDDLVESTYVEEGVTGARRFDHKMTARMDRVYLGGLADGDFFGEFSFLTERPRSATVETITDCVVVEIDRKAVDDVTAGDPAFKEPLMRFYKERVVELMMAKSPVFSVLDPTDRRALIEQSVLVEVPGGDLVVKEGARDGAFFFIKRGEVEVFRDDPQGDAIFINKLGQGEFFGEIAALKGTARTVSVRAMGPLSVFRIDGMALHEIVAREPQLRQTMEATIASRTRETQAAVQEHHRIFFDT